MAKVRWAGEGSKIGSLPSHPLLLLRGVDARAPHDPEKPFSVKTDISSPETKSLFNSKNALFSEFGRRQSEIEVFVPIEGPSHRRLTQTQRRG